MPWLTAQEAITITIKYRTRLTIKRMDAADFGPPEVMRPLKFEVWR